MKGISAEAIRSHYDRLSIFYRWFWGEHIHHGFWRNGESPPEAQVKLIEELARYAAVPRQANVLDVGCGFGASSIWLARQFGCSVRGITLSRVQQRIATNRAQAAGVADRVCFEVLDANEMEFASASFDVVWVIECSEHLGDKRGFIDKCARILRPGGVLALCSWLAGESLTCARNTELLLNVCRGMLCPSLATLKDYVGWMNASGFINIRATDVTRQVEKTWEICEAVLRHPITRAVLPMMRSETRQFAAAFSAIRRAYAEGAMAYGMFRATKP